MGKWTQGPWRIGYAPPNGEQTIGTKGGLLVAVATAGGDIPTLDNARLIAAAPELADALMAFVEYNDMADSGCCDVATMIAYADALEKARAALAKAGVL